jgi:TRAP-type C4-dicarboxylate transport system permease small subunit
MKWFWRLFAVTVERMGRLGALASELCLVLLLVLVFHEVVARYLFNKPTTYSVELSEYLLIFLAFMAAGWVLQEDKHVRMQSILHLFPKPIQHLVISLNSCIVLFFCSILVWQGSKAAYIAWRGGYHSSSLLNTPMWIPYLVIPVGSLLLALQLIVHISTHFSAFLRNTNT